MFAVLAGVAALCFSIAGYFTKLSQGLTVGGPTTIMFGLFILGAAQQAVAMRNESMGLTYAVVLELEAVTPFLPLRSLREIVSAPSAPSAPRKSRSSRHRDHPLDECLIAGGGRAEAA